MHTYHSLFLIVFVASSQPVPYARLWFVFRSASSLFTREAIASCSGYQTGVSSFGLNSEQRLQRGFWHNRHKYFVVSKHEKYISISGTYNSNMSRPCRHFGFVMQAHDHLWKERKKEIILIYAFFSAHENGLGPQPIFPSRPPDLNSWVDAN